MLRGGAVFVIDEKGGAITNRSPAAGVVIFKGWC